MVGNPVALSGGGRRGPVGSRKSLQGFSHMRAADPARGVAIDVRVATIGLPIARL